MTPAPRARSTDSRQRQRLIDACISALHLYGPSRTTVEKVVAIAKMSPGIVRFYFDSKAAMLVASLQYLAAEFEERLLQPVARLRERPVAALELMVDLYLDPDIASPRKVSVWYAFWGEASSRQEYYDICGQKDERFAALVKSLLERLIEDTRQAQLDPDAIALGLIGVLEILWQGFAFQSELTIDRPAAKHRCMAYLRSIFPEEFAHRSLAAQGAPEHLDPARVLPRWSCADPALAAVELATLFQGSSQFFAHRWQFAAAGDFRAVDAGTERVLALLDAGGLLRTFRDSCPAAPHRLSAGAAGRLPGHLECRSHGLRFGFDGACLTDSARPGLLELESVDWGGLLFVHAGLPARGGLDLPQSWSSHWLLGGLDPAGLGFEAALSSESLVGADWKLLVESWLGAGLPDADKESAVWEAPMLEIANPVPLMRWSAAFGNGASSWSVRRYRALRGERNAAEDAAGAWRRMFVPPNQLFESRPDGLAVLQVFPAGPGRARVRRHDFAAAPQSPGARALAFLARRIPPALGFGALRELRSMQEGIARFGYESTGDARSGRAQRAFRAWLRDRLPALRAERAPSAAR